MDSGSELDKTNLQVEWMKSIYFPYCHSVYSFNLRTIVIDCQGENWAGSQGKNINFNTKQKWGENELAKFTNGSYGLPGEFDLGQL